MPGFNRTGPMGEGALTGRGLGRCNPKNENQDDNITQADFRRGRGFGRGRGLRRRNRGGW